MNNKHQVTMLECNLLVMNLKMNYSFVILSSVSPVKLFRAIKKQPMGFISAIIF